MSLFLMVASQAVTGMEDPCLLLFFLSLRPNVQSKVGPCSVEARLEILPARGGPRSEVQSSKEMLYANPGWRD